MTGESLSRGFAGWMQNGVRQCPQSVLRNGFRVQRFGFGLGFWGLRFCGFGFGGLGFRGMGFNSEGLHLAYCSHPVAARNRGKFKAYMYSYFCHYPTVTATAAEWRQYLAYIINLGQ